jgi:hypothetical protein
MDASIRPSKPSSVAERATEAPSSAVIVQNDPFLLSCVCVCVCVCVDGGDGSGGGGKKGGNKWETGEGC